LRVCDPLVELLLDDAELDVELGVEPAADVVPVIFTSCPTCALSFEVSPERL
jgi:hypothetical protein